MGFEYRVYGSGTWIDGWNDMYATHSWEPWHSGESFSASLSNLLPNTAYECRAQVKNALGTGYGSVKTFTTSYSMYNQPPPGTPAGGPTVIVPPWGGHYTLSPTVKLIIALITTIGGMIAIGVFMGKNKAGNSSGIVIIAYGLAAVVGFGAYDWYPRFVLYLLGGIVALGLLLALAGRAGGRQPS